MAKNYVQASDVQAEWTESKGNAFTVIKDLVAKMLIFSSPKVSLHIDLFVKNRRVFIILLLRLGLLGSSR